MEKDIYLQKAIEEILNPKLEITKQYLEVLEVKFKEGKPEVERFEDNFSENNIAIYFKIKGERFFLEIHLNKKSKEIDSVWIQNGHRVYLTATSENRTYLELENLLDLKKYRRLVKRRFTNKRKF